MMVPNSEGTKSGSVLLGLDGFSARLEETVGGIDISWLGGKARSCDPGLSGHPGCLALTLPAPLVQEHVSRATGACEVEVAMSLLTTSKVVVPVSGAPPLEGPTMFLDVGVGH